MKAIGDFLLSAWLWHITFDWFYPIITGAIMFLMFRIIMRYSRRKALATTFAAQFFAYLILMCTVAGLLVHLFGWEFEPVTFQQAMGMNNELVATIHLGIVYALIQTVLFFLGWLVGTYSYLRYLIIIWISNALGVMANYAIIKMISFSYYV